jgi:hypothetical protein
MSINFIDKGPGLIEAIEAAGHMIYQLDGEWVASDPVAVQAIIDAYQPAPPPVPQQVTMRQARIALIQLGLFDKVEAALAAIPDPIQRKVAQQTWEYSAAVERFNPLIVMLAPALGLTAGQVDDLFRLAATL